MLLAPYLTSMAECQPPPVHLAFRCLRYPRCLATRAQHRVVSLFFEPRITHRRTALCPGPLPRESTHLFTASRLSLPLCTSAHLRSLVVATNPRGGWVCRRAPVARRLRAGPGSVDLVAWASPTEALSLVRRPFAA